MVLGFALIFPLLDATPDQYLTFMSENQTLVYLWNLITYWGSAITLVVMSLALYGLLKDGSPVLARIRDGLRPDLGRLDHRQRQPDAAQPRRRGRTVRRRPGPAVTAWTAHESVEVGITSGNDIGGQSVGAAAERGRTAHRPTEPGTEHPRRGSRRGRNADEIVPALYDSLSMVFGLGMVVWSIWLGIVLLRQKPVAVARQAETFVPHGGSPSLSR